MSARTIRRPRETWDWLTVEDVERFAFAAFFEACRRQSPPAGEPFVVDGSPWATREDFRDALVDLFAQRVNLLAIERGVIGAPGSAPQLLPPGVLWPDREAMAHGCAAVAVGAGAPPAQVSGPCRVAPDDPLFFGPEGQDLPEGEPSGNTQTALEAVFA